MKFCKLALYRTVSNYLLTLHSQLFGAHLFLFIFLLQKYGSKVPRLLIGAQIVFEDVFGEEIRLPYREFRHWEKFSNFLTNRFLNQHGEQYVAKGQFCLYDWEGSHIPREQWQRLVPNSKIIMSIIVQVAERNICGRCFRVEEAQESGIVKW